MKYQPLLRHIEIKRSARDEDLAIVVFKPSCPREAIARFRSYCSENHISILQKKETLLSRDAVVALYPKIFSFSNEDLKFGLAWKKQTIDYLTSAPSRCFLVGGEDVYSKLSKYKYRLRDRYGKITHPKAVLSTEDFFEKVIKNIVHVIDEHELQNGLWVLFDN